MSKSKLRITSCEDCSLCERITNFHINNDVRALLAKVPQWDIDVQNQFKYIKYDFMCLVCSFKTKVFNDWKSHIMSISHMADSHRIKTLYSFICTNKGCKVLLYGTKKSILSHKNSKHSKIGEISALSVLMAEVMRRYIYKLKPLYYCSKCKKFKEKPIHTDCKSCNKGKNNLIEYYCKFCKVTFISSPEMIDYHSLSVEHLTLKCFNELCSTAKISLKRIKLSNENNKGNCLPAVKNVSTTSSIKILEQLNQNKESKCLPAVQNVSIIDNPIKISEQSNQSKESNCLPVVENLSITNSIKLPMVVLNRFKQISEDNLECKLCSISVDWRNIYNHLIKCKYKSSLTDSNYSTVKTFKCNVCSYSTNYISGHKMHIISYQHLANCHDTINYYSYFCELCITFMYGNKFDIKNHLILSHEDTIFVEHPLFIFMANVFIDFNKNPNRIEPIHYYGKNKDPELLKLTSFPCHTCKIEFHTSVDDFNMHTITSEHIILTFLSSNENNLTSTTSPAVKPIEMQDVQDHIKDVDFNAGNECFQNIQINTKYQNSDNNICKNTDFLINEKQISNVENPVTTNMFLAIDKKKVEIERENDEPVMNSVTNYETPKVVDEELNHEVLSHCSIKTLSISSMPTNVIEVNGNKSDEFNEDRVYGEYVVQRLQNIENATVKQKIKLEIDYLFYTKMI